MLPKKSSNWLLLLIVTIILVAIGIGAVLVFTTQGINQASLLEWFKLVISILGPAFLLVLFVVLFNNLEKIYQQQMEMEQNKNAQLAKEKVHQDFYSLLQLFVGRQSKLIKSKSIKEMSENLKYYLFQLEMIDTTNAAQTGVNHEYHALVDFYGKRNNKVLTSRGKKQQVLLQNELIKDVTTTFANASSSFGLYCQNFLGICQLINANREHGILSKREYHQYYGLLFAQLSEKEYFLLVNYVLFSPLATELAIELTGSPFFLIKDRNNEDVLESYFAAWGLPKDSLRFSKYGNSRRRGLRNRYQSKRPVTMNYLVFRKQE